MHFSKDYKELIRIVEAIAFIALAVAVIAYVALLYLLRVQDRPKKWPEYESGEAWQALRGDDYVEPGAGYWHGRREELFG